MNKYQAFIFDMDGTIVSSLEDIFDSVNYSLEFHGLPTRSYSEMRSFLGNGSVKLIKRALGKENESYFDSVFDTYYKHYLDNPCVKTKPYEGVVEALSYAKKEGILLFVFTNKPEDIARKVADICFGKDFFADLVGIPLGGKVKPDVSAFVERSVKKYSLDNRRCAYFGDSGTDILTAHNLNIDDMYAVSWGYVDEDVLSSFQIKAKKILHNPLEIIDVAKGVI